MKSNKFKEVPCNITYGDKKTINMLLTNEQIIFINKINAKNKNPYIKIEVLK